MTVNFTLDGLQFTANAGPMFKFNEAVSFVVSCDTQEEIDAYWEKLIAGGGAPSQCGWLKDRFGLSWQIVPQMMGDLTGGYSARRHRMMQAMLQMQKLDVARLRQAYDGV